MVARVNEQMVRQNGAVNEAAPVYPPEKIEEPAPHPDRGARRHSTCVGATDLLERVLKAAPPAVDDGRPPDAVAGVHDALHDRLGQERREERCSLGGARVQAVNDPPLARVQIFVRERAQHLDDHPLRHPPRARREEHVRALAGREPTLQQVRPPEYDAHAPWVDVAGGLVHERALREHSPRSAWHADERAAAVRAHDDVLCDGGRNGSPAVGTLEGLDGHRGANRC